MRFLSRIPFKPYRQIVCFAAAFFVCTSVSFCGYYTAKALDAPGSLSLSGNLYELLYLKGGLAGLLFLCGFHAGILFLLRKSFALMILAPLGCMLLQGTLTFCIAALIQNAAWMCRVSASFLFACALLLHSYILIFTLRMLRRDNKAILLRYGVLQTGYLLICFLLFKLLECV